MFFLKELMHKTINWYESNKIIADRLIFHFCLWLILLLINNFVNKQNIKAENYLMATNEIYAESIEIYAKVNS